MDQACVRRGPLVKSEAIVSVAECVCEAGSGLDSGVCTACPAGKFKTQLGDEVCGRGRPAFSDSPADNYELTNCQ
jgi:hypothetical protein